ARPKIVGEDRVRSDENVVFQRYAVIESHAVFYGHVVPDRHSGFHEDAFTQIASRADARTRHDVRERPDARALADVRALAERERMDDRTARRVPAFPAHETCCSAEPARSDRSTASSTRTTAMLSAAPDSGLAPSTMQSRKCSHSARSGSPAGMSGTEISPSRIDDRKPTKLSTIGYDSSQPGSVTGATPLS